LQHELAHVARHDYLMQLMASVTCALYWCHPGVWYAARRLRNESERACDDAVLARGTPAADYAAHLLSVATGSRALRLTGAVAIGMARQSALEGRLLAALNPSIARSPLTARAIRYGTVALGAFVLPLAGLRAVPKPPAAIGEASQQQRTRIDTLGVRAANGERLLLDLDTGGDVVIHGWDEDSVRIRATLRSPHLSDMTLTLGRDREGAVLRSRFERKRDSQQSDNSFEIRVPRRFDVRLSSAGGNLTIYDVEGEFSGTTGGGEIVLERARGRAQLSTGGGDVRVHDVEMRGNVSTGGGKVTLTEVTGGLRGHSGSGPVIQSARPNVTDGPSRLSITKAGGDIVLDEAPGGAEVHTGGGTVRIGRSAGLVEASTGGGDITIGPVAGSVVAGTGAGTVTVTLVDAGGAEQNVDISAGVGRVIVRLPASFDGTFDLETAYSRRFGRATRIESDWDLDRETTDVWDNRQGTPRRYVRANGTAGRGRGRVRITTMNGDIEIRRQR
jgi:DUF4097 and DUF4098 domain-containing protein YvlB